jgi:hypothetical protein
MKKTFIICSVAFSAALFSGCGTNSNALSQIGGAVLGNVLGANGANVNTDALGNILGSVLGASSIPTQQQLIGTWNYSQPGCAFTSDQLLAQAGGEIVASQIKSKLQPTYETLGIRAGNTRVTFSENSQFSLTLGGKTIQGTYTYDEKSAKVTMKATLITINCYAKRNTNGLGLLFESSKLLTVLQTLSALSGNSSVQAVGEISKSYDGLRIGFDFSK